MHSATELVLSFPLSMGASKLMDDGGGIRAMCEAGRLSGEGNGESRNDITARCLEDGR